VTLRRQEDWHRHGLRSPEDIASLAAARLGGPDAMSALAGAPFREPTYADFLGAQL